MILDSLLKNQINSQPLIEFLSQKEDIHLVGGAVRDYLLGIESQDLDFVLGGDVIKTARGAARVAGGKFFVLDDVRSTARVILPGKGHFSLDFTLMRCATLEEDLKARDFTINAIAVNIKHPEALIDPLRGVQDLHDRVLRICSQRTYKDDPLRILRAIRLAFQFNLRIEKESLDYLKLSIPQLSGVSTERIRDELFHVLNGNKTYSAFRSLEMLGVLRQILPEMIGLTGTRLTGHSFQNQWEFALATLRELDLLCDDILEKRTQDDGGNLKMAVFNSELGVYKLKLGEYLRQGMADERNLFSLLKIAGLYSIYTTDNRAMPEPLDNFVSKYSDQKKLTGYFLTQFALSQNESARLAEILLNQNTMDRFVEQILVEDRRGIYQYFRLLGPAGLDIAILRLARVLAENGHDLSHKDWLRWLSVMRVLCHAWFEKFDEWIEPVRLLTGFDVQSMLGISPGPELGQILGALEESQAAGVVNNSEEAAAFVTAWYEKRSNNLGGQ